jgi:hypothetical protein
MNNNNDNNQKSQNKSLGIRDEIEGKKFWKTLDKQFIKVFDASLGTYYINKHINKIIVIVGLILIGYALIYHSYSAFVKDSSNILSDPQSIIYIFPNPQHENNLDVTNFAEIQHQEILDKSNQTQDPNQALESNQTQDPNQALESNQTQDPNQALESNQTQDPNQALESNQTQDPQINKVDYNTFPDLTGIISGGSGIASLITLFFYKSQKYIQQSLTNLAITQMIYKSHYLSFETISDYHSSKFPSTNENEKPKLNLDEINKINKMLLYYTNNYISILAYKSQFDVEQEKPEVIEKLEEGQGQEQGGGKPEEGQGQEQGGGKPEEGQGQEQGGGKPEEGQGQEQGGGKLEEGQGQEQGGGKLEEGQGQEQGGGKLEEGQGQEQGGGKPEQEQK